MLSPAVTNVAAMLLYRAPSPFEAQPATIADLHELLAQSPHIMQVMQRHTMHGAQLLVTEPASVHAYLPGLQARPKALSPSSPPTVGAIPTRPSGLYTGVSGGTQGWGGSAFAQRGHHRHHAAAEVVAP